MQREDKHPGHLEQAYSVSVQEESKTNWIESKFLKIEK